MTKEEILRKNIGLLPYINSYEKSNSIFEAMDEYAKQQSIAFTRWYRNSEWSGFMKSDKDERKTLSEIYDLFLDHQLKQQV